MNINSIRTTITQQNYGQVNNKQQVGFASQLDVESIRRQFIITAKDARKVVDFTKKVANDGKDWVIEFHSAPLQTRECEVGRRGPLSVGETSELYNSKGKRFLYATVSSDGTEHGKVAPHEIIEICRGIPRQIKSIYNQAARLMAPIDEKKAAQRILKENEQALEPIKSSLEEVKIETIRRNRGLR